METILLSIALVAFAFLALGVGIFFLPKRKFPETEVGHNKNMRELNISCAKCDERRKWNEVKKKRSSQIIPAELKIDLSQIK
ncbi:MAG: hypothetical protein JW801_03235 [Bacteroidales bacterium]|nr:hypothetical protein [Bacteroidales bacterium]